MLNTFVLYTTTKPKNINLTRRQYYILHFNEDCYCAVLIKLKTLMLQLLFLYS